MRKGPKGVREKGVKLRGKGGGRWIKKGGKEEERGNRE
jgi:hypothetical protein